MILIRNISADDDDDNEMEKRRDDELLNMKLPSNPTRLDKMMMMMEYFTKYKRHTRLQYLYRMYLKKRRREL